MTEIELSDNQYAYDVAGGTMYVTVLTAVEREHWARREDGYGSQRVKRIHPRLMIRTSPEQHWDDTTGFVKVRGRQYSTWNYVTALPDGQTAGTWDSHWTHEDTPYNGGYRSETGSQMGYQTKAREALRALEVEVLNRFEVEHPEWRRTSERLRLEGELRRQQEKAAEALAEAAKHDAEAARVAELLKSYA